MGDRGNILIGGVYLYTHWGGSELHKILQDALKKRWRWDDTPYLTRIIFCEMIKGCEEEETGFAISTKINDNEHNILEVDVDDNIIIERDTSFKVIKKWSFEDFIREDFKEEMQHDPKDKDCTDYLKQIGVMKEEE